MDPWQDVKSIENITETNVFPLTYCDNIPNWLHQVWSFENQSRGRPAATYIDTLRRDTEVNSTEEIVLS